MTTETRQVIQYVAITMFALFTLAMLAVFVYDNVSGKAADPIVLGYLASIIGTISVLIGVNSGANTAQSATQQANQNTAAVAAAVNGSGGSAALAHVGLAPAESGPAAPAEVAPDPVSEPPLAE